MTEAGNTEKEEIARKAVLLRYPNAWKGMSGDIYSQPSIHWKISSGWIDAASKNLPPTSNDSLEQPMEGRTVKSEAKDYTSPKLSPTPQGLPQRPKFISLTGNGLHICIVANQHFDALESMIAALQAQLSKPRKIICIYCREHLEDQTQSGLDSMQSHIVICGARTGANEKGVELYKSLLKRAEAAERAIAAKDVRIAEQQDRLDTYCSEVMMLKQSTERAIAATREKVLREAAGVATKHYNARNIPGLALSNRGMKEMEACARQASLIEFDIINLLPAPPEQAKESADGK